MKTWPLFVSIVIILAIVCSPALAISKADLISQYKGQSAPTIPTWTPTPIPTKPTPTPTPPTLDISPIIPASYPHIPASYYEWSKFPPEPTPRVISDEEWEEAMAKFYEYMAKHDAIRVLA